ncbi:hypothetical protein A7U60_g7738 [Sanghuangporus baumii]|uniref:DUF6534 domain-containing protein n=1 Tax=Sanghuangporus baumii TaxID=108892 RepID=A0A9Q5N5G6_SANBA|nr:hypothetical protein A7U60_g7738 [Sanghuangporus baumii]
MATADLRLSFGAMFIGCVISVGYVQHVLHNLCYDVDPSTRSLEHKLISFDSVFVLVIIHGCLIHVALLSAWQTSFSGIGTLQAYYYFRQYRSRDSPVMKSTVFVAWFLDLVHTVFICQGIWHYLVLSWGDLSELDHLTWMVGASIAVTGLITFTVQMFFANRVWRLSKHNVSLTALIVILAIVRIGSAFTTTVQMIRLKRFSIFIRDFRWLFTFGLALSSVIDLIITSALCYYLQGNRTGIDDVIHRLLLYTINNGLLTAFASLLAMVFAAAMPHNFVFLSLHFIIAKCYINSLLATLNSRDTLNKRDESHPMAVHISVEGPDAQPRFLKHHMPHIRSHSGSNGHTPASAADSFAAGPTATVESVKVQIDVEQTIHRDDGEIDVSPDGSIKSPYLHEEKDKVRFA